MSETYVTASSIGASQLSLIEGDWANPDRSILAAGLTPPPPLPLEHLGAWGDWARMFALGASAPPDYAVAGVLAAAAAAVGAARKVSPWPGWSEFPALWVLLVGPPSASKSPVYSPMVAALRELERGEAADLGDRRRQYETKKLEAQATHAGWEAKVREAVKSGLPAPLKPEAADDPDEPKAPRIVVSDVTVESLAPLFKNNPRGLIACRDELAGLIGSFNKYGGDGDAAMFLERFNGQPLTVDRVKAGHTHADIGLLSIFGGIQPERLAELLLKRADDGLVSRFLLFYPAQARRVRPTHAADMGQLSAALYRLRALTVDRGDDGALKPRILPLSSDGLSVFEDWWQANGDAGADAVGMMQGTLGKGAGLVLRLALLIELLTWAWQTAGSEPASVGARAVSAACILFDDYLVPMAARTFGGASRTAADLGATQVLRHLRQTGEPEFSARDIQRRRLPGLASADPLNAALAILKEGGWVRELDRGRSGPGRPRGDWMVNPELWEAKA